MGGGIFEVPVCQEPCLVVLVLVMMLLVNVSFCHPILLQILLLMTYEGSLPIFFIPPFFLQNIISFSSPWYSDCLGRRLGPKLLGRTDDSGRLVKDFVKILNQVNSEEVPTGLKLPESFNQLVVEMKNNKYSAKEFALMLKGMVCTRNSSLAFFQDIFTWCVHVQ